jgi:hypothetical protein
MSRQELHQFTQRLRPRQAAHAERRTHQRRGGPRQAGTRGGVFPQKISNSERVLLTVLHLRRLCTLDVLADALGDVCRSAIGNAVRDTRPLLEQTAASHPRRPSATAPPPNSSPPEQPAATRLQLDSLRLRWTRQRCRRLVGNTCSAAPINPGAPSEMISTGDHNPRPTRLARNPAQASWASPAAGAKPSSSGTPPVVLPQATRTGSARAPGCSLQCEPSRYR